jgi:hypothetical protein
VLDSAEFVLSILQKLLKPQSGAKGSKKALERSATKWSISVATRAEGENRISYQS